MINWKQKCKHCGVYFLNDHSSRVFCPECIGVSRMYDSANIEGELLNKEKGDFFVEH